MGGTGRAKLEQDTGKSPSQHTHQRASLPATSAARRGFLLSIVVAILIGACGGAIVLAFRWLVTSSTALYAAAEGIGQGGRIVAVLMLPCLGGALVAALVRLEPAPGGHGMGNLIASMPSSRGLSPRSALSAVLGCVVTTTSGGSAGCEGPIARVAAGLGSFFGIRLGMAPSRVQVLVACGASASIAGLFHAPIAGVVFATEIILGGYAVRTLAPLVVSAVTATALVRAVVGKTAVFEVPPFELKSMTELAVYAVLGCACGLLAVLFVLLLNRSDRLWERAHVPKWSKPAIGGLFVGVVAVFVPQVWGVGYPAIADVFRGGFTLSMVAALMVAKMAATALTLGTRGLGGVFAPSLLVGASAGTLVGTAVHRLWPEATAGPAAYALVGMAALLVGMTHAPLTGVVLLFELADSYKVILPGMIASVLAVFVASTIRKESAYTRGVGDPDADYASLRQSTALLHTTVETLLRSTRDIVADGDAVVEIRARLHLVRHNAFVVVSSESGEAIGVIGSGGLSDYDADQTAGEAMVEVVGLRGDEPLARAVGAFQDNPLPVLPVVNESGLLRGVITREELMDFCARDLLRDYLHLGARDPSIDPTNGDPRGELQPLADEVCALPVPQLFAGKTLRELDLGRRYGVVCIGLRRSTREGSFTPIALEPQLRLEEADVLIVSGPLAKVEQVRRLRRVSDLPPKG